LRSALWNRSHLSEFCAPAKRQETIVLGWALAVLIVALIAGALGGIVAGTVAAVKIGFVTALLAVLVSAVVEVSRRGVP
jgi:uncharacterized membrane protein YtjA (UPF0391 family)